MLPTPASATRTAFLAGLLAVSAPSLPSAAQPPASGDERSELVDLQRQQRWQEALDAARRLAREHPEASQEWGLDVLVGELYDHLGQPRGAVQAFARAMGGPSDLKLYARYRLAGEYAETGHPEMAAGLVASVVAARPGATLTDRAVRLLGETVERGGECRLLGGIDPARYDRAARRRLQLTQAHCARRRGTAAEAREAYRRLLGESLGDEVALTAALALEGMTAAGAPARSDEERRLLGLTFHQHRDFDRAVVHLGELVGGFSGPLSGDRWDLAYAVVRSRFWQERYAQAAHGYAALAARSREPRLAARALYQQARCHELMGDWPDAAATYRLAYRTDPDGEAADVSLLGALRLEWRSGAEVPALDLFELLKGRPRSVAVAARGAFFLAASDLVQGRGDRAGAWLDVAARDRRRGEPELSYWRGRLAELEGDPATAVRRYLRVMELDTDHPLALDAARRVRRPELAEAARELAGRRLATGTLEGRYQAWILVTSDPGRRARIAHDLARELARDPAAAPYLTLTLVPSDEWPLWSSDLDTPPEKLLALGLWVGGAEALGRHFPLADPSLAFTRSWLLARAGALRESLEVVEILVRRKPDRLPPPFLPPGLQRLLYPFAHPDLVVRESLARGIDPHLLSAVIREESRFDREALSPASARGLTQFVQPTAERVAARIGLDPPAPADLYRPEVAIALGAAYLEELVTEMGGARHAAIAAYNAGLPAARLWQSYCYSGELAEYFTKVGYFETRSYLAKVMASRARYREIYGAPDPAARIERDAAGLPNPSS